MGIIRIETWGSFPQRDYQTCAENGGHAAAINRAMVYLAERMPDAIKQDHELHNKGVLPQRGEWGGKKKGEDDE